jgi:hypothetical protein
VPRFSASTCIISSWLSKGVQILVVALTARYGGLLWGEHGKGFRAQYSPAFFGETLFRRTDMQHASINVTEHAVTQSVAVEQGAEFDNVIPDGALRRIAVGRARQRLPRAVQSGVLWRNPVQ